MQVSLTKRGMTSFDATRLNSKEEQQMLRAIAELDLSYNSIAFVKGMQSLGRLTELNLSHNCLETLDRLPLALRKLDVSHNNLTMLTGMASLVQLQVINCSFNALVNLQGIPPSTTLRIVDASHNKLNTCRGVEHCTGLVEINVSANLIADAGQLTFLRSLHSLRVLDIADNPLTHRSVKLTQDLRAQMPRIEVIRTGNPAGKVGRGSSSTWVSPSRQQQQQQQTAQRSSSTSAVPGRHSLPRPGSSSVVVAPRDGGRHLEDSIMFGGSARERSTTTAGVTPDASVIQTMPEFDLSTAPQAATAAPSRSGASTAAADCLMCDDLRVEIAALRAQLQNEQTQKARLQDELATARLEIERLRQHRASSPAGVTPRDAASAHERSGSASRSSSATQQQQQSLPRAPTTSARVSLSAAVAALAESRARLQSGTAAAAGPSTTIPRSAQLQPTSRLTDFTSTAPAQQRRPMAADVSVASVGAQQDPLGYHSSAAQGLTLTADRRPTAADGRRPLSADGRHRPSTAVTSSLRESLRGVIAPLPSLQRSASADHSLRSRPRSADTSMASTSKSVTFGPNQYFSPPSYR